MTIFSIESILFSLQKYFCFLVLITPLATLQPTDNDNRPDTRGENKELKISLVWLSGEIIFSRLMLILLWAVKFEDGAR